MCKGRTKQLIDFQFLKMLFFQTALQRAKCDPKGSSVKIAIFSTALHKIARRLGTPPPNPCLRHVLITLVSSPRLLI